MVVRGDRIDVPETLRQRMIEIGHEGRTKQLLRAHVWFPGMDSQCDKFVSTCIYCQSNTPDVHREPLKMMELPEGPWRKVSVHFCGPLANGRLAPSTANTPDIQWLNVWDPPVKKQPFLTLSCFIYIPLLLACIISIFSYL